MTWQLLRPSFWPEPRDPWAWQRALLTLAALGPIPDPRPCWEGILHDTLSRRSVVGLYGLRPQPMPPTIHGVGFLEHTDSGWVLAPGTAGVVQEGRSDFQAGLAEILVRRSAWVRLALMELAAGRWILPRGAAGLGAHRQMRVGTDLVVPSTALRNLPDTALLLGDLSPNQVGTIHTTVAVSALSALHAPLYLLHATGWLDNAGRPRLPDALAAGLGLESPAAALRRIAAEEQDAQGFVPLARVAQRLRSAICGNGHADDLAAWTDGVIGGAIQTGAIEVHAWAPGQPRHGRGLYGDRDRKRARWTVHDDLQITAPATGRGEEADR
jgi:hypothetical protein